MKDKYKEFGSGFVWGFLTVMWVASFYQTGTILFFVTACFTAIATIVKLYEIIGGNKEDKGENK